MQGSLTLHFLVCVWDELVYMLAVILVSAFKNRSVQARKRTIGEMDGNIQRRAIQYVICFVHVYGLCACMCCICVWVCVYV